jgi:hypothetical protein
MNDLQPEKILEALKIIVVMQEFVSRLNAKGGDQTIDRFAHGDTAMLEGTKILGGLRGDPTWHFFENRKYQELIPGLLKFPIRAKASQDLAKDQAGQPYIST